MSSADPGGGASAPPDITNLQQTFSQQQAKISALKKLVRDAEHGKNTTNAQEKVRSIAQRLTHLKLKASRSRQTEKYSSESEEIHFAGEPSLNEIMEHQVDTSSSCQTQQIVPSTLSVRARSETPGSEKIQLLRLQMEQNRQKMAEREHNNRGIEEMVTQLKAKFDSTQLSLEKSSELGKSIGDLSLISSHSRNFAKSSSDLSILSSNIDKDRIKSLQNKIHSLENKLKEKANLKIDDSQSTTIKQMENKILDLEENLKEKECIIEARTQAVSLMSENLSLKGKNTVELLEETKQEMFKMQKNFIKLENDMKSEIEILKMEMDEKNNEISNLTEKNVILETARFDLTIKNSELEQKTVDVPDYSTKLDELNKLNQSLQHRISDLENQKYEIITDDEIALAKQATFEHSDKQIELCKRIKVLEQENTELNNSLEDALKKLSLSTLNDSDIMIKYQQMEDVLKVRNQDIEEYQSKILSLEEILSEKTIEYNVLNVNFAVLQSQIESSGPKMLFSKATDEGAELEITKLKSQLDEGNKGMIKMKLKVKQLQKQIDNSKKTSDVNQEIEKLTDEVQLLQQKLVELEEEKGNLQLRLVNEDTAHSDSELQGKIKILEQTCQNQTSAIKLLEEQKSDMSQVQQDTKHELVTLKERIYDQDQQESVRVISHFDSIELEEKIERLSEEKKLLESQLKDLNELNVTQNTKIAEIVAEKNDLNYKLELYLEENTGLLNKIEKLSLEKASSNESIEIVEGFTQEDKMEIEEYQKLTEENTSKKNIDNPDLSDSLIKMQGESSELLEKIELFNNERKEVLEKMDLLTQENQEYSKRIIEMQNTKDNYEDKLEKLEAENSSIKEQVKDMEIYINKLSEKSRNEAIPEEVGLSINRTETYSSNDDQLRSFDEEKYKKSLKNLENELELFKKTKDKTAKLKMMKKICVDAKNLHDLLSSLIEEHETIIENCKILRSELKIANSKFSNLPTIENLKCVEDENKILNEELIKCRNILKISEEKLSENENAYKKEIEKLENENLQKNNKMIEQTQLIEKLTETENELNEKLKSLQNIVNVQVNELNELKNQFESRSQTAVTEIDILKVLVAEQKQQLIDVYTDHEAEVAEKTMQINEYANQIKQMSQNEDYMKSKDRINQIEELAHKQNTIDTLNEQIIELYKSMEENTNHLTIRRDELEQLLETKSIENNDLNKIIVENQIAIKKFETQIALYLEEIKNLKVNSTNNFEEEKIIMKKRITEMERSISDLDNKNKEQLEKLKKYAANLKKKVAQINELEEKLSNINLPANKNQISELDIENLKKKQENLIKLLDEKTKLSDNLQHKVLQLEQENQINRVELNKVTVNMQQSHDSANEMQLLKNEIENLKLEIKDKSAIISKIEISIENYKEEIVRKDRGLDLFEEEVEKLNADIRDRNTTIEINTSKISAMTAEKLLLQEQIDTLTNDQQSKNVKIEKCKAILKEKNKEIQKLKEKLEKLEENKNLSKLESEYKSLQELYNRDVDSLKQNILNVQSAHKTTFDGFQAKIQEKLLYIETIDLENANLLEKVNKLQEGIRQIDERRLSLERQSNLLGNELEEKTHEFNQNEDVFAQRLAALEYHDENIRKHLIDTQNENIVLNENLKEISEQKGELLKRINILENHINFLENDKILEFEKENYTLIQQKETLQIELKKVLSDCEKKLMDKHAEIDELELELSAQLQRVETEKKNIQEALEKSNDDNIELQDELVRLKDNVNNLELLKSDLERDLTWTKLQNENLSNDHLEVHELRMQLVQCQKEIENFREENALRKQTDENDFKVRQKEKDDQVILQNENKRLYEALKDKELEMNEYQQQTLQLKAKSEINEFFSNPTETFGMNEQIKELQNKLQISNEEINKLQQEIIKAKEESLLKESKITELKISMEKVEQTCNEKQLDIVQLNDILMNIRKDSLSQYREIERGSNFEALSMINKEENNTKIVQQPDQFENIEMNEPEVKHVKIFHEEASPVESQKIKSLDNIRNSDIILKDTELNLESQILVPSFDCSMFFGSPQGNDETVFAAPMNVEPIPLQAPLIKSNPQECIRQLEKEIECLKKLRDDLSERLNSQNQIIEGLRLENRECSSRIIQLENKMCVLETSSNASETRNTLFSDSTSNLPAFNSAQFIENGSNTFFDKSDQRKPVIEEFITPKKSYVCGPEKKRQKRSNMDIILDDRSWGWEADPPRDSSIEQMVISTENAEVQTEIKFEDVSMENKVQELQIYINSLEENYKNITTKNEIISKQLEDTSRLIEELKTSNAEYINRIALLETFQQQHSIEEDKKLLECQNYISELEVKCKKLISDSEITTQQLQVRNKEFEEISALNSKYLDKMAVMESNSSTDSQCINPPSSVDLIPAPAIVSFDSNMFFDLQSEPSNEFDLRLPVVEEIVVAKNAYVCGPEKPTSPKHDKDLSQEEGWAWGSEDVNLEEQHQKLFASLAPPLQMEVNVNISTYEDKIDELELEKKRLKEEVIALQIKSGKYLKKLKEYKNKNDQLLVRDKKSPSVESDLDVTIQEELNLQVKTLESKMKEMKVENEKQCIEKTNLLKRIDVLTAANDRMTEMKERQDNEVGQYQYQLRELNMKLQQLQEWSDESFNVPTPNKETNNTFSNTNIIDLEKQIVELKAEINDLTIDNEEYQALLEEEKSNNKITESKLNEKSEETILLTNQVIENNNEIQILRARIFVLETEIYESVSKIDLLTVESTNIKIHLDKLSEEHRNKIDENNNLSRELTTIIAKNSELSNEIERMKTASLFHGSEFSSLPSSSFDFQKSEEFEQKLQLMTAQLQYKDSEILHLNQKIQDVVKEDQTQSLVQEILNKNQEIHLLKTEVQSLENDKTELENNLSLQLTQQLLPLKNEELNKLRLEINVKDNTIKDLEKELILANNAKCDLESELQIVNEQVLKDFSFEDRVKETVLQLDMKTIEINELKKTIEKLKINKNNSSLLLDSQRESQELTNVVDTPSDAQWKQYLNERENEFAKIEHSLRQEIFALKNINNDSGSQGKAIPPIMTEALTLKKMEEALESQEIEIVTLKEQLAIRSAEYASLATRLDPYAQRPTSSMGSSLKQIKVLNPKISSNEAVINDDSVPRGELDLALYMLHQRDMRCEELTLELISLLEERDTLQLKLSNSIRQIEEIRRKPILSEDTDSGDVLSIDNTPEKIGLHEETVIQQLSREKGASDLKTKLSELQGVSHSRDKTFREDREQRERQMSQLQKDISNIPSEAVAQLVGTDYTLSRTSQSPSSVLINWLMGRSTPKEPQS